jgi:hypothetical protein
LVERDLPKTAEKPLAKKLTEFAMEVDQRLEAPNAHTSVNSQDYARAIEKGSNDKARRVDRHEALVETIEAFLRVKK